MDLVCEVTKEIEGEETLWNYIVYTNKGHYWGALHGKGYGVRPSDEEQDRLNGLPEEEKTKMFAEYGKENNIDDLMHVDLTLRGYRKEGWDIRWGIE